ncbi:hypothetical protein BIFDEN_00398 [Bifidobacterium dentium ATCC 27678]|uniref:Uncharacterized protein n=1 Tax=Bifidobacterium dentium (strain ATCC 27534 / DSM 20436 / JCM 1195 / Bd1) TaxID=401473 RepID=D2Q8C5_BIFDB|nr:hypothetical protein BDP_0384 [Bifidobacterium dentium Bd1]EDT44594.1 hypothetical protein BIFDEN_00398 [Bifidobacterium dentium ATCC 27678]ETO98336.1 hypothetical protein HMPREF1494_0107 [Bifidobacterium sp. MSTE12]BAQ26360.1 hypothetical protein BBDE_0366 [Bifidobacterium dentium JCM 1195 = DSM 20436]
MPSEVSPSFIFMESAVPEYEMARLPCRYAGQESGLATMPRIGGT